jgi:hypothetical protein
MSINKSYFSIVLGIVLFVGIGMTLTLPEVTGSKVCGSVSSAQLIAEEDGADVGNVLIWNSQHRLHTRFEPAAGWKIVELSYQPGRYFAALPMTNDTLSFGAFEYQRSYRNGVMATTLQTPMSWELGSDLHIAGRAVLVQYDANGNEIARVVAWGDGKTYSEAAPYFKHIVQPCSN